MHSNNRKEGQKCAVKFIKIKILFECMLCFIVQNDFKFIHVIIERTKKKNMLKNRQNTKWQELKTTKIRKKKMNSKRNVRKKNNQCVIESVILLFECKYIV